MEYTFVAEFIQSEFGNLHNGISIADIPKDANTDKLAGHVAELGGMWRTSNELQHPITQNIDTVFKSIIVSLQENTVEAVHPANLFLTVGEYTLGSWVIDVQHPSVKLATEAHHLSMWRPAYSFISTCKGKNGNTLVIHYMLYITSNQLHNYELEYANAAV